MTPVEKLLAIEEIKRLKAKYFLGLDTQDFDLWREEVWAPDARLEVPEMDTVVTPRETLIDWVRGATSHQVSAHHGHMPIIEITSDTTATAIWAMEDVVHRQLGNPHYRNAAILHGFGHYHETYVRLDRGWRIQSSRLTRLRLESTSFI